MILRTSEARRIGRAPHADASGRLAIALIVLAGTLGCSAAARKPDDAKPAGGKPAVAAAPSPTAPVARTSSSALDLARLEKIHRARSTGPDVGDYPIGPGDVVEISVPGMAELDKHTARVSGDGILSLPLLGDLPAAGKTEAQLVTEIEGRLLQYMHRPAVALVIREHHNRQVGVLGAVETPGLHSVQSGRDTILEMISKAGGLTEEATQRLVFLPAEAVDPQQAHELTQRGLVAGAVPASTREQPSMLLKASKPIVIDLENMNEHNQRMALAVPVRPGDTIMALGGGQVFVQGWVHEPGAYPMKRGLTALGAIGAAGGLSYPADKSSVRVLREGQGEREIIAIDLERVERGEDEDISLHEGDLIEVEATGAKLAAYGAYHFFTNVMQMGFALSPF